MATDNNYLQHLGVVLISVLENSQSPELIDITVLDGGISEKNKDLLHTIVHEYGSNLTIKNVVLQNPEKFIVNGHISIAAYYRILLPEFFDDHVKKVIYLDCDVIVNSDIKKLYDIDLENNVIGAVAERLNSRMVSFGYPDNPYFNSGVLVIDLKKWISENITQKTLDFIFQNPDKLIYWDQDALNVCLIDKWLPLDYHWNYQREHAIFEKAWKNKNTTLPHIVHFSNNVKPWHYYSRNPYDQLYYKYLADSPWNDFKPFGKNIRTIITKNAKLTLRKLNLLKSM